MNGTGLAFISLLIVVLIAVALGTSQIQAQQVAELKQIEDQRNLTVGLATEAMNQRDIAYQVRDEAVAMRDDLQNQIALKEAELNKKAQELDNAQKAIADLNNKVTALQANNASLLKQVASQPNATIPSTGNGQAVEQKQEQKNASALCLPVQANNLPSQIGLSLAVLIGMVALGGGGYAVYHHDSNRKYMIKMSREQLKDFTRYQRERGNRVK